MTNNIKDIIQNPYLEIKNKTTGMSQHSPLTHRAPQLNSLHLRRHFPPFLDIAAETED